MKVNYKSMKYIKTLVITGILAVIAQNIQAEDFASLYTIRDAGKGALNADFSTSSYSGKEIARITGSGYDGKYSGYSNQLSVGGNIGIGYNTELLIIAPYVFNSYQEVHFDNGIKDDAKHSGLTTVTVGAKYRLFTSDDGKNEVQLRGYLTAKDAIMQNEEADLTYLYKFSDTTKIALDARYYGEHNGPETKGINVALMTNIAPNILLMPFVKTTYIDAYQTYTSYNTQEAALSVRFNADEHWHITPEVFLVHNNEHDTNYYANNIGTSTAYGFELKVQREF